MIEIDGSYGEGGGQIVRTAVALSAVTGKPVRIKKIRQGRPKPGLAPQHAQAISSLARICSARIKGVEPGSPEISFEPEEIQGGHYRIDIGTAGSITLLMQCLMPATLKADGPVTLEIHGGTDVQWSPTIDYFKNVFLPALARFKALASLEIRQRGYYPKGQGSVLLKVEPSNLESALLTESATHIHRVEGISHCSNLPEHVARRQAESALQALKDAGIEAEVSQEVLAVPSTGSGITIWSGFKGASALGERGLPAEKVGRKAAEEMISEKASDAVVDVHLADQLIPYIALAGGSYTTREISMHARTNIWTARHFLDREIKVSEEGEKIFRIEAA
ncbi:MAG TPA: RNA 3'-terminal phosphate cyclase [Methanotrichaceae archaeon]|nr:RNA 3'-terminal phosphate cyclase [Methanotrichaceae archaeon]